MKRRPQIQLPGGAKCYEPYPQRVGDETLLVFEAKLFSKIYLKPELMDDADFDWKAYLAAEFVKKFEELVGETRARLEEQDLISAKE